MDAPSGDHAGITSSVRTSVILSNLEPSPAIPNMLRSRPWSRWKIIVCSRSGRGLSMGIATGVGDGVAVGVGVRVAVAVAVASIVGAVVGVAAGDAVAVGVGIGVGNGVEVGINTGGAGVFLGGIVIEDGGFSAAGGDDAAAAGIRSSAGTKTDWFTSARASAHDANTNIAITARNRPRPKLTLDRGSASRDRPLFRPSLSTQALC